MKKTTADPDLAVTVATFNGGRLAKTGTLACSALYLAQGKFASVTVFLILYAVVSWLTPTPDYNGTDNPP